jgi:hypothetical protein
MQADDFAWEIDQAAGGSLSRDVHAMHGRQTARHRNAVYLADHESVMVKKLRVAAAVAQVPFGTGVVVQAPGSIGRERWRVDGQMHRLIGHALEHFAAIAVVDGVLVGDYLVAASHFGILSL